MPRKQNRGEARKLKDPFVHSNLEYWREELDLIEDGLEQESDWDFYLLPRNQLTIYSCLDSNVVETIRMTNELILVWNALGYQATKKIYAELTKQTIVSQLLHEAWLEVAERLKQEMQLVKIQRKNMIKDVEVHDNDSKNADLIFPEEVWEIILDLLPDWRDMNNCSNVCTVFRKILRPFTVQFLFPVVFACLYKYLDGAESLNCREVCKAWCDGVDRLFENHASLRPYDAERSDPRHPPFLTPMEEKRLYLNSNFADGEQTVDLMERICMPGRNPFIGRAVVINVNCDQKTANFLQLYGKHIWYLTVQLDQNQDFLLEHTPNLRKLRIISSWYGDGPFFNDLPPSLPNLETLQLDIKSGGGISTIFHAYHLQLKRIYVEADDWLLLYNLYWPALTELHLNKMDLSFRAGNVMNAKFSNSLLQANMPNLRKLACGKQSWLSGPELCPYCGPSSHKSHYNLDANGLTFMLAVIAMMSVNTDHELNTFRFRFSEHISLEVKPPRHTMDEVTVTLYAPLSLKTLENLNLFLRRIYWKKGCEDKFLADEDELVLEHKYSDSFWNLCEYMRYKIDIDAILDSELVEVNRYLYTGEMYKSNIWEVLPHLNVFTFQLDVYTRDGYEKFWNYKKSGSKQGA